MFSSFPEHIISNCFHVFNLSVAELQGECHELNLINNILNYFNWLITTKLILFYYNSTKNQVPPWRPLEVAAEKKN